MPGDGYFGFSVLIAGLPVAEYRQNGKVYVESNLWTPVSYKQSFREMAYGEVEEQEWPVTPYQIKIYAQRHCPNSWYYVYVDGVCVNWNVLDSGKEWICEGFIDSEGTREFLFALPRFARDESDRIDGTRKSLISTIGVDRYSATYIGSEWGSEEDIEFDQANKKDATAITGGGHTMSTTKKGKLLSHTKPGVREIWDVGGKLGKLSVEYHMSHTLQDKGFTLQRMDWTPAIHSEAVKSE